MLKTLLCTIALILLSVIPISAAELLTAAEQDFEGSLTPGRWQLFTWPATGVGAAKAPGGFGANEEITGGTVTASLIPDATTGLGSSSIAFFDLDIPSAEDPDAGGAMITVDVVPGATYVVSAHVKFASDTAIYNSQAGMTIDTDGGVDPSLAEFGVKGVDDEFDFERGTDPMGGFYDPAFAAGNWMWNGTFVDDMDLRWWGPQFITTEVTATGNSLTLFIYGLNKNSTQYVAFDGISIQGQAPPPYNPATVDRWSIYR